MTGVFVFEYAFPLVADETAPQVLTIAIDVKASSEAEAKQLADQQLVNSERWTQPRHQPPQRRGKAETTR